MGGLLLSLTGLAGCGSLGSERGTRTPNRYRYLQNETVYIDGSLSVSLPAPLSSTPTPTDADIVLLPATTETDAATAVEWFTDGKYVGLLGHDSEDTYHRWKRSDAYADAFGEPAVIGESRGGGGGGGAGSGGGGEPPELVVAWRLKPTLVTTHRATWGHTDAPSDREILTALNRALDPDRP
jgi:hypothetical protein